MLLRVASPEILRVAELLKKSSHEIQVPAPARRFLLVLQYHQCPRLFVLQRLCRLNYMDIKDLVLHLL